MLDADESVFVRDLLAPVVERAVVQFDDLAALAADEMVVMTRRAGAVSHLAIGTTDRIDLAVFGEASEISIDRRQSDRVERFVQFLRGHRVIVPLKGFDDRRALFGATASGLAGCRGFVMHECLAHGLTDNDSRFYYDFAS